MTKTDQPKGAPAVLSDENLDNVSAGGRALRRKEIHEPRVSASESGGVMTFDFTQPKG
ncbi:MAG: hypothetical protein AAGC81_13890 [Pseudomonadota bacterium]